MPSISRKDVHHMPTGSNIYIYNLHPGIDSKTLDEKFSQHGTVVSCKIVRNSHTGQSLCRGYVQYGTKEEADKAIEQENGKYFAGSCIRVDSFLSKEERLSNFTSKKAPAGILNVHGIPPVIMKLPLKVSLDCLVLFTLFILLSKALLLIQVMKLEI